VTSGRAARPGTCPPGFRFVALVGVVAVLAGCGSRYCTSVGCVTAVEVDLGTASATFGPGALRARLCVQDDCTTEDLQLGDPAVRSTVEGAVPTSVGGAGPVPVTVSLRLTRGATVLADSSVDAVLTRTAPNGEDCGPVCWFSRLHLVDGALRASP
jgi:hypothetical protein